MKGKKKIVLYVLLTFCHLTMFSQVTQTQEGYEPQADSQAVVTAGKARFTVLTPELIRIQYSSTSTFENRASFAVVNRKLPVPAFTTTDDGDYLVIKTEALTLRYRKNTRISAASKNSSALSITFNMNGSQVLWYPGKDDALNLKGTTRTLDNNVGDLKRPELENGILSRAGWSIIDESPQTKRGDGSTSLVFDKNVNGIPWVAQPIDPYAVDWYFMGYGHQYKKALTDYTKIAGKQPMPPLYVMGYWYSRYWRYSQQDFVNLVNDIQQRQIPIDVMILDMNWHTEGWTGWTWDRSIFPDPPGLLSWMHGRNLRTSLNLHPADGVDSDEQNFNLVRNDMGLPTTATVVPWALEDSTFYKSMFKRIIRLRESEGVDFWWLDWQQNLVNTRMQGLGETFWCNHVFYNDMKNNRPERRPVIFHRWGGLGSHRYPIGFSGDAIIDYSTLDFEIYFTATASNVCFGYWGHDLGGHQRAGAASNPNDPELYLRWMQFGVFTPVFRSHATNDPSIERRIWLFDNFNMLNDAIKLRYAMMPYIYTAARDAYDTGISICRPLYYDSPEENNAYRYEDEYMFGNNILVAPIVKPTGSDGMAHRQIWLPKGQWFDVSKNKLRDGNIEINEGYTQAEIPYFYQAGAVIPTYQEVYNLQARPNLINLKVAPGADGTGVLYEDEGDNENYKKGAYTKTTFTQKLSDNSISLKIGATEGYFTGMPATRDYQVDFLGIDQLPKGITLNDAPQIQGSDWTYDATKKLLTMKIHSASCASSYTILIDGISTAIKGVLANPAVNEAPSWNLAGQRVNAKQRGIIVKKGKKYINHQ